MKSYFVYILTNYTNTTFYIGVSGNIERRIFEHKAGKGSVFTSKYNLAKLVYLEEFGDILVAIQREKRLKKWNREWKINLITKDNPMFQDIAKEWYDVDDLKYYRDSD